MLLLKLKAGTPGLRNAPSASAGIHACPILSRMMCSSLLRGAPQHTRTDCWQGQSAGSCSRRNYFGSGSKPRPPAVPGPGLSFLTTTAAIVPGVLFSNRRRHTSVARHASFSKAEAQSSSSGVTLYTAKSDYPALNGWKLTITLEELREAGRIPEGFRVVELDLGAKEHKEPWFLEINPNGRIPALVDHEQGDLAIFESGAMMLYLAETRGSGCLLPQGSAGDAAARRYSVMQWLFFQVSGVGPIQGQAHAFLRYVPEEVPYAKLRFVNETRRLYSVLDDALSKGGPYIAGEYSIADIALYPWVEFHAWAGQSLEDLPALERWRRLVATRPAVIRGMAYNKKDISELLSNAEAVRRSVSSSTLDAVARDKGA